MMTESVYKETNLVEWWGLWFVPSRLKDRVIGKYCNQGSKLGWTESESVIMRFSPETEE